MTTEQEAAIRADALQTALMIANMQGQSITQSETLHNAAEIFNFLTEGKLPAKAA